MNKPTIKSTRALLGLSQSEMGRLMGMPASRISDIECGQGGRRETKGQQATLRLLLFLHERGLLGELEKQ